MITAATFYSFRRDYLDDYRIRAAAWFGSDMRTAIVRLVELLPASGDTQVLLTADIPRVSWYWRFYLAVVGKESLQARGVVVEPNVLPDHAASGSLLLGLAGGQRDKMMSEAGWTEIARIGDLPHPPPAAGLEDGATFVVYQKE